jgi:hypothetical protein
MVVPDRQHGEQASRELPMHCPSTVAEYCASLLPRGFLAPLHPTHAAGEEPASATLQESLPPVARTAVLRWPGAASPFRESCVRSTQAAA